MRTIAFLMTACGVALSMSGCGWNGEKTASHEQHAPGGVAVIDLDLIAKELGRDVQMANSIKQQQNTLTNKLKVVQASYLKQIDDKKQELGEEVPEDEKNKQIASLTRQAGLQLNQERQKANTNLSRHRIQLISNFRNEVRPVAHKVATEKGLSMVVTKNDSVVFTHQSAVDITADVIKRMKNGSQ